MNEQTKKCFKCETEKPLNEYYKHKKMLDGHLNKCKACTKNDVSTREKEMRKDPKWVLSERKRGRKKYHRLQYKGKYKPAPERKREIIKRYQQKYPEKAMATKYTEIFLTKLPELNLHHWSYNQEDWLDVIELSIKDHNFLHCFLVYDQPRMMYCTLEGELLDTREKHLKYFEECKEKYKEDYNE